MGGADNRFKESLLDPGTFSVTWELVPGRGAREKAQETCIEDAAKAARGGIVHGLALTDNPGGNPAILADCLGAEILRLGIEPLVHFTCKDRNRGQIESQLYALDRAGVRNLLVMSGDYPAAGFQGRPAPVFDLDPLHAEGDGPAQAERLFRRRGRLPLQGDRGGADGPVLQAQKEGRRRRPVCGDPVGIRRPEVS